MRSDGYNPREAQSTGLDLVGTCLQMEGDVNSWIWLVRMVTKIAHLCGEERIQASAVVESVQAVSLSTCRRSWNVTLVERRSWAARRAPHNSSRGMVTCLSGATRVLAVTR